MTAPGENLEFRESVHFKARAAFRPGLTAAVLNFLMDRPDRAKCLVGPVWSIDVLFQGRVWTVHFSRVGQRIGLMNAFGPGHEEARAKYEWRMKETFGKEGKR